jgi:rhodanese-related sulfurtransferase
MPLAITAITAGIFVALFFLIRHSREKQRLLNSHIDVANLNAQISRGERLTIVDLRHPLEVLASPQVIPGAVHIDPAQIEDKSQAISRDAAVVLYCTCPNAETSMKALKQLQERGFRHVRALSGGLPEWKEAGLPLQELYPELQQQLRKHHAAP